MDLGTNTFHLLIVDADGPGYKEIVHEQQPVKLGEGGINKGFIQAEAFERGVKCMQRYAGLITENRAQRARAIATSALRNAANGQDFINEVAQRTGIRIEIISGEDEAAYIYKGVRAGKGLSAKNILIVDIGGGSVEFIICNEAGIKWKQSFEIGAARLMDKFHREDPITPDSVKALENYLAEILQPLFAAISHYPVENIIGSSGVFESYAAVVHTRSGSDFDLKKMRYFEFNKQELLAVIETLIHSTHHERKANRDIIPVRVDMIVTASLLTRFIIKKTGVPGIAMSASSLKEGVLAEMAG